MSKHNLSQSEKDFIEQRGLMSEEDGQPRILGRIWALLMVVGAPIGAGGISELLEVSRGSVSTNLKLLDMMEILKKSTQSGSRETFYEIKEQPYSSLVRGYIKRMSSNLEMMEKTISKIENPEAKRRLKDLATFYRLAEENNQQLLKKLEES
ncbi:MAG: hypothetical protein COA41_17825 [Sphingopyxis sp.]|nr:MAG: hypothetical protein COA41_17825 [Sphingopyxis sp.]